MLSASGCTVAGWRGESAPAEHHRTIVAVEHVTRSREAATGSEVRLRAPGKARKTSATRAGDAACVSRSASKVAPWLACAHGAARLVAPDARRAAGRRTTRRGDRKRGDEYRRARARRRRRARRRTGAKQRASNGSFCRVSTAGLLMAALLRRRRRLLRQTRAPASLSRTTTFLYAPWALHRCGCLRFLA